MQPGIWMHTGKVTAFWVFYQFFSTYISSAHDLLCFLSPVQCLSLPQKQELFKSRNVVILSPGTFSVLEYAQYRRDSP